MPGYELRRARGRQGRGDGRARAQGGPRRLPDLLRRGRQGHPRAACSSWSARTELNAVVIDVKGDRGLIPYRTAGAAGARGRRAGAGHHQGLRRAHRLAQGARHLHHRPHRHLQGQRARPAPARLAIIDTRTGKPWIDNEKLAWVDPFREEVWDYNIAIAKEAVAKGFDEVQFDYVRFPTDGKLSAARYSQPNNAQTRLPAIAGFLAKARRELGPTGAFLAADVFGYTAFNENDTDIGQRVEELAPHLDYICPMVYPSGYHRGIPGVRNPVAQPYEIVKESVRLTRKRSATRPCRSGRGSRTSATMRSTGASSACREIRAQIEGADDGGAVGLHALEPAERLHGRAPCAPKSDGHGEGAP